MFEKADDFDAVLVATPDHTHAVIAMMALKHRKHVYCEKPLTRTVFEARAIGEEARKAGVITQMGNQGMASEGNRLIKEWLSGGSDRHGASDPRVVRPPDAFRENAAVVVARRRAANRISTDTGKPRLESVAWPGP